MYDIHLYQCKASQLSIIRCLWPNKQFFVYLNIFVLARKEWLRREKQIWLEKNVNVSVPNAQTFLLEQTYTMSPIYTQTIRTATSILASHLIHPHATKALIATVRRA